MAQTLILKPQERLQLYEYLRDGRISLDGCDFAQVFRSIKVFPKDSASATIVMAVSLKPDLKGLVEANLMRSTKYVIAKIRFEDTDGNNSLVIEEKLYRDIMNDIVAKNYSPNVVTYIGTIQCDKFLNSVQKTAQTELQPAAQEIYDQIQDIMDKEEPINFEKASIMLLEAGGNSTVNDWLNTKRSEYDLASVLFQILYTLDCFNFYGVKHNDIHMKNILLKDLGLPRYVTYRIGFDKSYTIKMRYYVQIFDLDLGTAPNYYNTGLDIGGFCKRYGICNDNNDKFDLFMVIWYWHTIFIGVFKDDPEYLSEVLDMLRNFVPEEKMYKYPFAYPGRLCKPPTRDDPAFGKVKCVGSYRPPDEYVLSTRQAVFSPYFESIFEEGERSFSPSRDTSKDQLYELPYIAYDQTI